MTHRYYKTIESLQNPHFDCAFAFESVLLLALDSAMNRIRSRGSGSTSRVQPRHGGGHTRVDDASSNPKYGSYDSNLSSPMSLEEECKGHQELIREMSMGDDSVFVGGGEYESRILN